MNKSYYYHSCTFDKKYSELHYIANNATKHYEDCSYSTDIGNISVVIKQTDNSYNVSVYYLVSPGEIKRIFNAANRIKCTIVIVGSRANGTATAISDWDYIIERLNNKKWKKIKNSLPGAKDIFYPRRNIDIVKTKLDETRPHMIISPSILLNQLLGYAM